MKRLAELSQQRLENINTPIQEYNRARTEYEQSARERYSNIPNARIQDYQFLDALNVAVNNPGFEGDGELERDRGIAAAIYANALGKDIGSVYQNLEAIHEEWTGQKFIKTGGLQKVINAIEHGAISFNLSILGIMKHHKDAASFLSGWTPEDIDRQIELSYNRLETIKDDTPRTWQKEYISQGGIADIGNFFKGAGLSALENLIPMATTIGVGGGAGAVVKGAGAAIKLSPGILKKLIAGAGMVGTSQGTALHTRGLEYLDLVNDGIPEDIAWSVSGISAQIQGVIESIGGGVTSTVTGNLIKAAAPNALTNAINKWFIKGRGGAFAQAVVSGIQQMAGESFEEGAQELTSILARNIAGNQLNARRQEWQEQLDRLIDEPLEESRKELEKLLQDHPEFNKTEFDEAWKQIKEAAAGGFATSLILGAPGSITTFRNNKQAAATIMDMATVAPNADVLMDQIKAAEEHGFEFPIEGFKEMKTDDRIEIVTAVFNTAYERLTPEQRKAKEEAAQDAAALAEITSYKYPMQTWIDETTNEEVSEERKLSRSRQGELSTETHETQNDNGSISGIFIVTSQERTHESDGKIYANEDARIDYTVNNEKQTVTVNSFTLEDGFNNPDLIRQDIWAEFTGRFDKGTVINWNLEHDQNKVIRQQLIDSNPRGSKHGLNYSIVTTDAQRLAQAATSVMSPGTSRANIAIAAEFANTWARGRRESVQSLTNRIIFTNDASLNPDIKAAQMNNHIIKGATWTDLLDKAKRYIYLGKEADLSTLIHELGHDAESLFDEAERRIAAKALNGYKISKGKFEGQIVDFTNINQWQDIHKEAFTDAALFYYHRLTNYSRRLKQPQEQLHKASMRNY
ncbi:MAG: hypothetical protein LBG94_09850 [Treponema sp.]|jgi:hypothetical protein|nr:hypothetical protein [Treponema sp.]